MTTKRIVAEALAREARYGAMERSISAIEAALTQAEANGAQAVLDSWIERVGARLFQDDEVVDATTLADEFVATARERDVYLGLLDLRMADASLAPTGDRDAAAS